MRLLAPEGVLQINLQIIAQIGAALAAIAAALAPAPAAHDVAEQVFEDIRHRRAEPVAAAKAARSAAVFKCGMAKAVVGGPLLAVGKALIGLVEFLELHLGG